MISADPLADNTDVYAFIAPDAPDKVTIVANWIPFEEPAGGPNFFKFADDVRYGIHIDNAGTALNDISYYFRFKSTVRDPNTFLYNTGKIESLDSPNWNVRQTFSVTRVDANGSHQLGEELKTPPVNIGPRSTGTTAEYEALATAAINELPDGIKVFAGQRDDPFFVDLGSAFDLLGIPNRTGNLGNQGGGIDGVSRYNTHSVVLQVPITQLTRNGSRPTDRNDPAAVLGVWATSERQKTSVLNHPGQAAHTAGPWVQVSRLGSPLVNEVVIPLGKKDLFNASPPKNDAQFLTHVVNSELALRLNQLYPGVFNAPETNRDDLVAVFLTGVAHPALGGNLTVPNYPTGGKPAEELRLNVAIPPCSTGCSRLGVVGGDLAGFPNGRRLTDDVTDIELKAVAGAIYKLFHPEFPDNPNRAQLGDGVDQNDTPFLASFPYVGTPLSGFDHTDTKGPRREPVHGPVPA